MMSQNTPAATGKQMSSTLKERLKRCGRYHASPKVMTPVAKQQEESHTNTAAKKLCTRETDEKSLLSTPNSKLNCDKNDIYSGCKTQSYLVNISKPLSELHPNSTPKTFKNISVLEPENHSLDVEKNCSEKLSAHCPQTSETQTAVGRTRMDMNRSLSHMGACKQSVNQSDVVSTLSTTPVSSRSMRRVNVKVNKLDFEKEKEGIVVNGPAHTTPSENSSETGRGVDSLCSDSLMMKHESESKNEVLLLTGNKSRSNDSGANNSFNERQCLLKEISEKEETIRKLRMVKMYRTKNNLSELEKLIEKWRAVSQQGLQDLCESLPEPKPSLSELLQHLGVEFDLVKFDPTEETFNI